MILEMNLIFNSKEHCGLKIQKKEISVFGKILAYFCRCKLSVRIRG